MPATPEIPFAVPDDLTPNHWYGVFASKQLKKGPVAITRMGEPLVLYRGVDGRPHCFLNRCPHRGIEFTHGRVFGDELECPFHAFRFAPDGRCTLMPCEGSQARVPGNLRAISFPTLEHNDIIWIWWGAEPEQLGLDRLPDVPWIEGLPDSPYTSQTQFLWPIPHRNAIENGIDAHHAPALHAQRRGVRGWKVPPLRRRMRLDPFDYQVGPTHIDSVYTFTTDDGQDDKPFKTVVKYQHPGQIYACINGGLHILSIDSPVDERTTWRIIRYYNTRVQVPMAGSLVAWLMRIIDQRAVQWSEDYWAIGSQRRPIPGVAGNNPVRSDAVVTQFNAMEHRLLAEAEATREVLPPVVRRHFAPVVPLAEATRRPNTRSSHP